ncbi:MAG: porin family protein [Hyphomicrobiales bacterium]|nr:porin family protein [Hyphomicrobiales bacterium]
MKLVKSLAAALAVSTLAGSAFAADLPSRRTAVAPYMPVAVAPVFTWTGAYVGLNGGGWLNSSRFALGGYNQGGGALIGGTLGYNWQMNNFVFGVETDLDYRTKSNVGSFWPTQTRDGLFGTLRGRAGLAFNNFMIYGTGGLAYGTPTAPNTFFAPAAIFGANAFGARVGNSPLSVGWTAGVGVEAALDQNWSVKAEYLYADLGSKQQSYLLSTAPGWAVVNHDTRMHTVRAGLNYRFGWGGAPVVAKY